MKFLFFLLGFFFIHKTSCCQTVEELDSQTVALYKQGDFKNAISAAESAMEIINKNGRKKHPGYATVIDNLATLYNTTENFTKAKPYYKLVSEYNKQQFGDTSEGFALSKNKFAILYEKLQQYDTAAMLYKQVISSYEKTNKKNDNYFTILDNLGTLYRKTGQYSSALPYFKIVADYKKQLFGDSSEEYALSQNQVAILYENMQQPDSAINLYKQALGIYEKTNKKSDNYFAIIDNLGSLYKKMEKYKEAILYFKIISGQKKQQFGDTSEGYALAQNQVGILFDKLQQYDTAVIYYKKAISIYEKDHKTSEYFPDIINNVAFVFEKKHDYVTAESFFLNALNTIKLYHQEKEEYAAQLMQLGYFYENSLQTAEAESAFINAAKIYKVVRGDTSLIYAKTMNHLGMFYYDNQQYAKAETALIISTGIRKKQAGENSEPYEISLNHLANVYRDMGNYKKAEPLYLKCLAITKVNDGETSESFSIALGNLASMYKEENLFDKAEFFYLQLIEVQKKLSGENSADYASVLNRLGVIYDEAGRAKEAEPFFLKAMGIQKIAVGEDSIYLTYAKNLHSSYRGMGKLKEAKALLLVILDKTKIIFGEKSLRYTEILNALAQVNDQLGLYTITEANYLQALAIRKEIHEEKDALYSYLLNNIGSLYFYLSKYDKAEEYYKRAIKILDTMHIYNRDYATYINNLAELYEKRENYKTAEVLLLQALGILKIQLGDQHPQYLSFRNNLAALYKSMGHYKKAELIYLQTMDLEKVKLGEEHPDYIFTLDALSALYSVMGDNKKAEIFYVKTVGLTKKIWGEEHPTYANLLNNMGNFYKKNRQYEKAEPLLTRAAEIRKLKLGENTEEYAESLDNLGLFYSALGQYSKAENFYDRSLQIYKSLFGKNNSHYASVLEDIGDLYESYGLYNDAKDLYEKSAAIIKNVLGEDNPEYTSALYFLGSVYQSMNRYDSAEYFYLKVADLKLKFFGEQSPGYASILNDLALVYTHVGKYDKAEAYFLKALSIRKDVLGETNTVYAQTQRNLGTLYENMHQFSKAEILLLSSVKTDFSNLLSTFTIMSEKEKEIYINERSFTSEMLNSFLYANPNAVELTKNNYNSQLILKSLSLADTRNMLSAVQQNKDWETQNLFGNWQNSKSLLSRQYALPVDKRIANMDSIENSTEKLEKELNKRSFAFRNQNALLNTTFTDVKNKLQQNEAAIEFVRFQYYDKRWTDSTFYVAYLLRKKDSVPLFIKLCEERQLEQLFTTAGKTTTSLVNSFYRGVKSENDNVSLNKGDSLYKSIWQPLEPYLNGINKISYSPAGKLYTIAFNALPTGEGKILMDKYELRQYTSTRQIALRKNIKETSTPKSIALFGDATFTLDSLQLIKSLHKEPDNLRVSTNIYTPQSRGANGALWSNLPGTATEVKKIQQLFSQNKITTKTFVQQQASEGNFKSLSGNTPQVMHLATHGFFLPEPDKNRKETNSNNYSLAADPLIRSGILLAGANYTWGGRTPINGIDDGIVTAYEISQLDLSKTELVVLSACETALGDIKGSEGVFGLQRAFKMAGVNKLIVSLWQVPDKETAELMTSFYSDWLKGNTIENSFYKAQSEMRKKYSPFYWAAFILVE